MPTVIVAGANRGIGLEFVRQYAADGWRVVAGCRRPAEAAALQVLARSADVRIHPLDTGSDRSVREFRDAVGGGPVEALICVAGVSGGARRTLGDLDFSALARTLDVNAAGPLRLAEAFASNLSAVQGSKLIAITSQMGSIAGTTSTEMMLYRISKAALNEAWKCAAIDLGPRGVIAALLHPGWVATDMGGPNAPVTAERSVTGMRRVIAAMTPDDAGTFRTFEGDGVPW